MKKHTSQSQRRVQRAGFTMIELLIVLAIIVAIAAMVAPNLLSRQREANEDITRTTINVVEGAIKQKAAHNDGTFPTGGEEVIIELSEPSTDSRGRERDPYLQDTTRTKDAWGEPLYYEYDPNRDRTTPRIWSGGANRQDDGGSGDDITNWEKEK